MDTKCTNPKCTNKRCVGCIAFAPKATPDTEDGVCNDDCRYFDGLCTTHGTGDTTPDTEMEKLKKEIIGWMNYGIPRGKTIPIFEDLVENLLTSRDTYWKERVRKDYQALKETPAYVNLMTEWGQLDEEGICIAVSRQALEETMTALDTLLDNLK